MKELSLTTVKADFSTLLLPLVFLLKVFLCLVLLVAPVVPSICLNIFALAFVTDSQ